MRAVVAVIITLDVVIDSQMCPHGTQAAYTYTEMHDGVFAVCVYRGQVYAEGQTWYDGCDFVCVCEPGSQGTYRCNDRYDKVLEHKGER